jgi:SAM-dependent methyltransferase
METLDELMLKHGADKASSHPVKGHYYARHYDHFFAPLRGDPITLLEIGVGSGNSHMAWLEYFWGGKVIGVDKVSETNPWNTPHATLTPHPRYKFMAADQTDETFYKCLAADYPAGFDIVVEDGGHFIDGVVASFKGLWPQVKSGGYYAAEDLGCGGTPGSVFLKPGYPTHMQWVHSLMERPDVDSFYLAGELLILRKR